ncbi:MAG: 50S ribosomal protein L11 methyltransferase [Candidatus Puniceispirillaceae bacterium]
MTGLADPTTPPLWAVQLTLDETVSQAQMGQIEIVFSELLDAEATAHLRDGGGSWQIEALFSHAPSARMIDSLLAPQFVALGIAAVPVTVQKLPKRDWLAENRAAFPPRRIDRFWVYGSHVTQARPAACWPLLVEAAQAFGSGTHPTTEGCLRAAGLIFRASRRRRWHVLDMGCGSAILALGALRARPASRAVAADNDPVAVRTAADNRQTNHIARHRMRCAVSTGFAAPSVRRNAPYTLVFANILAGPLCGMSRDLVDSTAPGGWIVLSGILNSQADMVAARYAAHGAMRVRRLVIGEWTTLVMRVRPRAGSRRRVGGASRLWHGRTQRAAPEIAS